MEYKYVKDKVNYEDFASGKVLRSAPGITSFPVRLASEMYQRCEAYLHRMGKHKPYTLYDPCCGGAYMLAVIGYLHGETINSIYASDIDPTAVELARKNLSLLTPGGLHERTEELRRLCGLYGKESHREALAAALRLHDRLEINGINVDSTCFQADLSSDLHDRLPWEEVDMLITDIPYGHMVKWHGDSSITQLLEHIHSSIKKQSVVAIIADKGQKIKHDAYRRLDYFKTGKRHAAILTPL